MKRIFALLLWGSFLLTLLVPFTGIVVHKLASTVFLLLCLVHAFARRRQAGPRRWALLAGVGLCFASGLAALLWAGLPWVLAIHKMLSMVCVFFVAIHIFVCRRAGRNLS